MGSILEETKKVLGISPDDDSFDLDVILGINNAFSTLNDVGVGPAEGFTVEDDGPEWGDFLNEETKKAQLSKVKMYVYQKARQTFDPPATQFHLTSLENQLTEQLVRISIVRENEEWVDPLPPVVVNDGGAE